MNYRIKIIDLKKCNSTDEVYDCFAETLNFNQGKDKSSEELKKQISKLDGELFSNVIIYNYGSVQNLGGKYFDTFLLHLSEFNKAKSEKILIDTDYISKTVFRDKLTIGKLFIDRPRQFGLRGDIGLWEDLKNYLSLQEFPENESLLPNIISEAIINLTGNSVFEQKTFAVAKYNNGGMSGGTISNEFWTRKAIPLIMSRMTIINERAKIGKFLKFKIYFMEKIKSSNWFKLIIVIKELTKSHFQ